MPRAQRRLPTGVEGLDAMLGGGVLEGDATLVAGSPGTGKTTLGLHFVAAGVAAGEKSIFVTFEYLPQQIYRDALTKGWPLKEWEKQGKVQVICTTPEVLLEPGEGGRTILDEAIGASGATRLVIDSMTHIEFYSAGIEDLRSRVAGLMNHLRMLHVTTLLTHEIAQIAGPTIRISEYGLEFLVDNVIILRYVELESELQKAINVMKFRGGSHDRAYRALRLTEKGMVVDAPFAGIENISTGSARRSISDRARGLI